MPHRSTLLAMLLAGLLTAGLAAQVRPGIFGYQVIGRNGTAGELCHVFDCTPRPLDIQAGETLTLRVNAPYLVPYAICGSFSATSCIPLPGVSNMLVIDFQIVTMFVGTISGQSPILACWDGREELPLPVPVMLPVGFAISTQAVAAVPSASGPLAPSFSVAVTTTVR